MVRVVPDLLRVFQKCACPLIITAFSYNDFDVSRQMLVQVDGMLPGLARAWCPVPGWPGHHAWARPVACPGNEMNVSMTSVIVQARGAIIILLQLLESEIPQRDPGMMPGLARAWCPGDLGTDRLL